MGRLGTVVKAYPELNTEALKRRKVLPLVVWYVARALSSSGCVPLYHLEEFGQQSKVFSHRQLGRALYDKELFQVYYSKEGVKTVRYSGVEAMCQAWGILPMAKPQYIPIAELSGVAPRGKAIYEGSLPTRKARPISRLSQECKYNLSERTLQRYSAGVIVEENWNRTNVRPEGKPELKPMPQPRMPNTYLSHYKEAKRGMLRRVYKALKPLDSKVRGENRERLYYPSVKSYLHSKHKGTYAYIRLPESPLPSSGSLWEYVYQN